MNVLEWKMYAADWVRDPNCATRWYAGHAGKQEPVFPLEIRVTDAIWLVTKPFGNVTDVVPLMRFETVEKLEDYLERNGRQSEAAAAYCGSAT